MLWDRRFDNSITVATMCSDKIGDHVMQRWQGHFFFLLMDTSLCPAELISSENAQQADDLFSCVSSVICACLTIPDQYYSIKEVCCFSESKPRNRAVDYLPSSLKHNGTVAEKSQWLCTVQLWWITVGHIGSLEYIRKRVCQDGEDCLFQSLFTEAPDQFFNERMEMP